MVKVSKQDKQEIKKKKKGFDPRSIFHPRLAIFLSSAPFMVLCPFILLGVLTGWPIEPWLNNGRIDDYKEAFLSIPLPENVSRFGGVYSNIGGFNEINGECDLISAFLVTSEEDRDDVSAAMLKRYQSYVDASSIQKPRPEGFDHLFNSTVKLFSVSKDEAVFNNDELNINVKEDFNITSFPDENVYVFYMVEFDSFKSRDPRCSVDLDDLSEDDDVDSPNEVGESDADLVN